MGSRVSVCLNRLAIVLYVLFRGIVTKALWKGNGQAKDIVVFFPQQIGDIILYANTLNALAENCSCQGVRCVKVLGNRAVLRFMTETICMHERVLPIEVDMKRLLADFGYFREILHAHCGDCCLFTVSESSVTAELFGAAVRAGRKIGILTVTPRQRPKGSRWLEWLAYTERIRPKRTGMAFQRHIDFLHGLGLTECRAYLPVLKPTDSPLQGRYCVIAPGASFKEKAWPLDRFVSIMDDIVEKYDLEICLCGSPEDAEAGQYLAGQARHGERIRNYIGKTDFHGWTGLIAHAELFVGNDSASAHIATVSRVRTVCILGMYHAAQFFPYQLDDGQETDWCIAVKHDVPCADCRSIGRRAGFGNPICMVHIRSGKSADCVEDISVEDVQAAIARLMI